MSHENHLNSNGDHSLNTNNTRQPLAIVGIGCRFPGHAQSPHQFWNNLCGGVDAISEVPAERWNKTQFYDPIGGRPGKSATCRGGFVDRLGEFDPQFFGISPREAARMDPQQRMLLEVAWEALEDAGLPWEQVAGSRTSVYVGISSWDFAYLGLSMQDRGVSNAYSNTGGSLSIASNRISYCLDLRGPSASVDTACSSALVSFHLACQSIWNEKCPLAFAGGVSALLAPDAFVGFSQLGMLSPDGRCKTFDARANGFVRGEGAGMVLLKPLAQALHDNDRIYAVVRATAVNQDGRTPGMTVPSQEAQETLLRTACRQAGVAPHMIQYVEAHGTGTPVGDPIETRALGNVLAIDRPASQPCIIGSVKTHIGHLEAGAGIASVIKVALSLYHNQIPPNLHFEQPNPDIDFEHLKLRVPVENEPWPAIGQARLAGINGFGYGGTNAHVILQGPTCSVDTSIEGTSQRGAISRQETSNADPMPELIPLSARSPQALQKTAERLHSYLENSPQSSAINLSELAGQLAHRRTHHDYRLVVVAKSRDHLSEQLALLADGQVADDCVSHRRSTGTSPPLTFVCSGQGPQWWAMGRQLFHTEPVFRNVIQRCDALSRQLGNWSLEAELLADQEHSRMHKTAIAQPAIFGLQVALAQLWRSWGVVPQQIVGHSVGEVAAAHLAGVYPLEEAFRIVYHRGRCMDLASSEGRMLAAGLSRSEAEELVSRYGGQVTIAAVNSPSSLTLSGAAAPLEEITQQLTARQVFWRELKVEYAFHSAQMDPIQEELLSSLADIRPAPAHTPLLSTVTGDWIESSALDGHYWWLNVRQTVRFADAIQRLAETSANVMVEISPHPVLAYSVAECFENTGKNVHTICSLRKDTSDQMSMLRSLGELHTLGYPIDWTAIAPVPTRHLDLPLYPWQHQTLWWEAPESRQTRLAAPQHPLLGVPEGLPTPSWRNRIDLRCFPYLADHRVQGMTIFPAAAIVEMALAAACATTQQSTCRINKLTLLAPCILEAEEPRRMTTEYDADDRTLKMHSRLADQLDAWTLHATAQCASFHAPTSPRLFSKDQVRQRCNQQMDGEACYAFFSRTGLNYGTAFQGISKAWRCDGEAIGLVRLPATVPNDRQDDTSPGYLVHPALLDACFHTVILADADYGEETPSLYLPIQIDQVTLHQPVPSLVTCHARLLKKTAEQMVADLEIYDSSDQLVLEVHGLRSQRVAGSGVQTTVEDLLYDYTWQPQSFEDSTAAQDNSLSPASLSPASLSPASLSPASLSPASLSPAETGNWLVFTDHSGVGDSLVTTLRQNGHRVATVSTGPAYENDAPGHYCIDPTERDHMLQMLRSFLAECNTGCTGVIHLWNLDNTLPEAADATALQQAQDPGVLSILHLTQAWDAVVGNQSTRLLLVTRGAQSIANEPELVDIVQSPIIGCGRVVVSEYPRFHCRLVDLDPNDKQQNVTHLLSEMATDEDEDEVAWRDGKRYVRRFQPLTELPQTIPEPLADQPYRIEKGASSTIDSLALRTSARRAPAADEVEIVVKAAALNFSDVMKVLGLYPGLPDGPVALGAECSGVIARVGEAVSDFAPGDEVIAAGPFAFGSHTIVPESLVAAKPSHLSFEEATTIPIAFLTAAYALEGQARLQSGERVLIHSASGGVGLAAVQLAQRTGAEIYATAGTEEKREFLRQEGISYIADSRTLEFADRINEWTDDRGVDVVLNSLPGEAIVRGLESLATGGRFLEIGKRDIYQDAHLGLLPFRNNLTFHAIDLDQLMRDRPARIGGLLRELSGQFETGQLSPLPHQTFAIDDYRDAFRLMQQGKHIGKIVLSLQERPTMVEWGQQEPIAFAADGTYLIAGGLGGFGLALAQWLFDRGARHMVLASRRGVPSESARQTIDALTKQGATIRVVSADISVREDVSRLLSEIRHSMPPLRGLFHAAMVLDDGLLLKLDRDWLHRVLAPKVSGAWNLHQLTRHMELDHFVLFSSLSSVFGHAGQANYAAANAFLDQLAFHRRAQHLPCLTINWGHLGGVGYLAERTELGDRLERQGVLRISIEQALEALELTLQRQMCQVSVMRVDWKRWRGLGVTGHISPRFAHLLPRSAIDTNELNMGMPAADIVHNTDLTERPKLITELLRNKIANLLGDEPDQLDTETSLLDMGLDSLMAVELRNWLESSLEVNLPVVQLMRCSGLAQLAESVCSHLSDPEPDHDDYGAQQYPLELRDNDGEDSVQEDQFDRESPKQILAHLDGLSNDQVDQLLNSLISQDNEPPGGVN